jgi:glycosyltransferase involved in cell wall biosynthesis
MKVTIIRARAIDATVYRLAETLSGNGYDVRLLVWDRQGNLKDRKGKGYTICKFNLRAPYDKFTALFYLPIWWAYEFFFLLRENSDVIHACDLDTLLPAILAKLIKRTKLCYTIYDFYANNLPDGRPYLLRRFVRSLVAEVEKFSLRFTQVLFLENEWRYEEVKGARINKLAYIYNSPPDYFDAKQGRKSGAGAEILIFYAGAINKARGLEHMIEAVENLDGVRLVIAGTGPDKGLVEELARRCQRIRYIGWIPSYEGVIKETLKADILFRFGDPKIPLVKYDGPNKLFEAMMAAKPIIINAEMVVSKIVQDENCGLVVPYGDVGAIMEAIVRLKNDPNLKRMLGANGRKAYEQKYGWHIMQERLLQAYREWGGIGASQVA